MSLFLTNACVKQYCYIYINTYIQTNIFFLLPLLSNMIFKLTFFDYLSQTYRIASNEIQFHE